MEKKKEDTISRLKEYRNLLRRMTKTKETTQQKKGEGNE